MPELQTPDPLEQPSPVEVPQTEPPLGVPAPLPDTIEPSEPEGIPLDFPEEQPQLPDPQPAREI